MKTTDDKGPDLTNVSATTVVKALDIAEQDLKELKADKRQAYLSHLAETTKDFAWPVFVLAFSAAITATVVMAPVGLRALMIGKEEFEDERDFWKSYTRPEYEKSRFTLNEKQQAIETAISALTDIRDNLGAAADNVEMTKPEGEASFLRKLPKAAKDFLEKAISKISMSSATARPNGLSIPNR